eukprot:GHVQ01038939.1.p1 GENE.GHVQ01038939.1~~GHVQ01038939.1.p1  ORF type:complete len:627 (+),score=67.34 GHVQ01038939.1:296-2176(+)
MKGFCRTPSTVNLKTQFKTLTHLYISSTVLLILSLLYSSYSLTSSPFLFPHYLIALAVAPINPYLADSPWPIAQNDNYAQASTTLPGPVAGGTIDRLFNPEIAGPLTVLYSEDERVVWGSGLINVFKVDRSGPQMRLIATVEKKSDMRQKDTFRGIYCVLDKDSVFYVSTGTVVSAYTDEVTGDAMSGIKHLKDYDFGSMLSDSSERVLALNLSYDGKIIFCTNLGGVGVLSRDLETLYDIQYATADKGKSPVVSVTNSVSIDEHGGIYVVTSLYVHRMWWDSKLLKLYSFPPTPTQEAPFGIGCDDMGHRLCQVWSTPYPVDDEPILSRPTKEGSGTTPSLLKDNNTGRLYVIIADGKRQQQVLAVDSVTGEIVAAADVNFKNDHSAESYTEQSILVSGNKLMVSQNALTRPGQKVHDLLASIQAPEVLANIDEFVHAVPEFVQQNVYLLPVLLGDSPRGFQQFELDTTGDKLELKTVWTRSDIGCPNAIPTMSETTGVMYCVGRRTGPVEDLFLNAMSSAWTIAAIDWTTGDTVFTERTGSNILYNSLYAATQLGPDKEIIYGAIGGLVRLKAPNDLREGGVLRAVTQELANVSVADGIVTDIRNGIHQFLGTDEEGGGLLNLI